MNFSFYLRWGLAVFIFGLAGVANARGTNLWTSSAGEQAPYTPLFLSKPTTAREWIVGQVNGGKISLKKCDEAGVITPLVELPGYDYIAKANDSGNTTILIDAA